MLHPSFRRFLDVVYRMSPFEGDKGFGQEAYAAVAVEAGAEIGARLSEASRIQTAPTIPGDLPREVLERVSIIVATAFSSVDGNSSDARSRRNAVVRAGFIGVMVASDGASGVARYMRNAGMVPLFVRHGLLRSASEAVEHGKAAVAMLRSVGAVVWPALACSDGQDNALVVPIEPEASQYRAVDPIYWRGRRIVSIDNGERLFHARMAAEALGYRNPRDTVTKLQRHFGLVTKLPYRDPSAPDQRRVTRFLTVPGMIRLLEEVRSGMSVHDESVAMLDSIKERVACGSGDDAADARIRHLEDANRVMVRARAIDAARIRRLEGLVAAYDGEVSLVRAAQAKLVEEDLYRRIEAKRSEELDASGIARLQSEVELLQYDMADLEERYNAALEAKAELRQKFVDALREKHGLDTRKSIGPRDDPSAPRH